MKKLKATKIKHVSTIFIIMSIFISWLFWSPIIGSHTGIVKQRITIFSVTGFILYIIAMTSMWFVALFLIMAEEGKEGVKNAYKKLFRGTNNALWYVMAILVPVTIEIVAPAILGLFTENLRLALLSVWYVFFVLLLGIHLALVLALGGTGFALQLFAKTHRRFSATLISSVYTMVWMAPMYLEVALSNPGYPILWYCLAFMPAAAMTVWLYHAVKAG